MNKQLLEGIRVLDFTQFLAGPYCSMFLADMGAEVIKIENLQGNGDFVRTARPKEKSTNRSMYFGNLNRNKKSVCLDLKTKEGKELFSELVKSADVLVENNRPGVMAKLGFNYEVCKKLNPELIYASISGFGQYGPLTERPGYDLIAQAMGGSMSITGWPGSEPTRAGMAIGDLFAGLNACIGILATLYKRKETGLGQNIDVALVDSIVSGLEAKLMQYVYEDHIPEKTGNKYIASAPYDSFSAKDTEYVIASGTDKHFANLTACMGMPELAQDQRFVNTELRKANADELKSIINNWGSDKTAKECVDIILGAGVPAGPIYNMKDVYEDEHLNAREMFVKVKHPEAGELTVIGNPIKMNEYPVQYKKAAPDLGEDDDEIFESLGFSKEKLEEFRQKGALK
ncbi:CoA transferase [Sedimentibacter hydroxybenzoicus DSM 7310]|uniref:CoA transferase n=1 Tax=Sedimentibacter hydroxybenzoicus DSM 7310 TaxID=1123245 RepID=A0A974GVW7_SEDHY|nr:CoA transferase [Sedimentibacter hydroxybenzoicus]NYB73824.1 CoA transferase [Sedimentibacter hydroxybenzoicus DSM 7310]